jgi:hypothetical protein
MTDPEFREDRNMRRFATKRGLAISLVVGFGAVMAIIVFAFMRMASNEMYFTAQSAFQKRATMLAFSGINVAEMALAKGRWYQPPYRPPVDLDRDGVISEAELRSQTLIDRPNFAEMEFAPDGSGEGTVRVFFQEIPKMGVDLRGNRLYARFKLDKADLLDHVKVYSVGEYRGERVMVYGKFIMSPSPLFNSPDVELASSSASPITFYRVQVDPPRLVAEQVGKIEPMVIGKIKKVFKKPGDRVNPNDVLFILEDGDPVPKYWNGKPFMYTQEANPKASVHGVIESMINPATGETWREGELVNLPCEMAVIKEDANVGSDIPSQTLKRMVMVLQIPREMYNRSSLAIGRRDTYQTLNHIGSYARELARDYVIKAANKGPFEAQVGTAFTAAFPSTGQQGTKVPDRRIIEVLDRIGPLAKIPYNPAGNAFMVDMLRKWRPRGFDITPEEMDQIQQMASFSLGVRETDPRESCREMFSLCQQFSEWRRVVDIPPPDRGANGWKMFSVWKPVYEGPDGFPTVFPLQKTWDYFERTLSREVRELLFPNAQPYSNTTPPYVFNKSGFQNPTAEFLKFRDFQDRYQQFGPKSDGGYSTLLNDCPPEEFAKRMANLKNACKRMTLSFMAWIPWQDWTFQDMVTDWLNGNPSPEGVVGFHCDNYWPWWGDNRQICKDTSKFIWPMAQERFDSTTFGAKGWPDQLRQRPGDPTSPHADLSRPVDPVRLVNEVDVPYTYELNFKSGQGLRTRLDYLMDYFRKYFDEPELKPDAQRIRGANDQTDTPQVPGPPDLLGASYTGLSS